MKNELPRRRVLQFAGLAVGASAVPTTARGATAWTRRDTPTAQKLWDVSYAFDGAYAVGDEGCVLERDGDWRVVTDDGPSGNGENLYGSGATDDGRRLWVVGNSGALGEYDATTGEFLGSGSRDFSEPEDYTGNFTDIVATGDAGDANLYVTDDSGYVHYSFDNGESWAYTTPGSGSTIPAISFHDDRDGHCADTNQSVFDTDDGENWVKIGVENRDENFYGVDSNGENNVWVAGGRGLVLFYDGSWSAADLGDVRLRDIRVSTDTTDGLTVGFGGRAFRRSGGTWVEEESSTDENLEGVVRGDPDAFDFQPTVSETPDIAVGAGGTIIEHQ
ncbi:MAG: hypothetical protein ABEJ79_01885 [Halolamina sp.]